MSTRRSRSGTAWWVTPAACVVIGVVLAGVHLVRGDAGDALGSFGLMSVIAVALTVGGRSEAVRVVRGDARDERTAQIDVRAGALAAMVLVAVLVVMTTYEWLDGRSGAPYVQLTVVGALAYVGGALWVRRGM